MKHFLQLMVLGVFSVEAMGASITYDGAAQYSSNSNPAGVWSYGQIADGGSAFTLATNLNGVWGTGCIVDPINPALSSCYVFVRYDDGTAAVNLGDIGGPALALCKNMNAPELSVARFTAPSNGTYRIQIRARTPWSFDMHDVRIRIDGTVVFSNIFAGPSMTFTNTIGLSAGATIDFVGSQYNYFPQSRLNYVYLQGGVVLVDPNEVPPDIAFFPSPGLFTNSITVSLVNNKATGAIRLTEDGTNPTSSSLLYAGPMVVTNAAGFRAALFDGASQISQVFTGIYARVYAIDDGVPASWREQYFGAGYLTDPRVSADADPDGDLSTNWEEYLAGTNPLDPTSGFKATVTAVPLLQFGSVAGRTYRILRRDHVNSTPTVVATVVATNALTTYVDTSITASAGIYMIELLP